MMRKRNHAALNKLLAMMTGTVIKLD